jgi:hypothetical protein
MKEERIDPLFSGGSAMKVQTDVKAGGLLGLDLDIDIDIDVDVDFGGCGCGRKHYRRRC